MFIVNIIILILHHAILLSSHLHLVYTKLCKSFLHGVPNRLHLTTRRGPLERLVEPGHHGQPRVWHERKLTVCLRVLRNISGNYETLLKYWDAITYLLIHLCFVNPILNSSSQIVHISHEILNPQHGQIIQIHSSSHGFLAI